MGQPYLLGPGMAATSDGESAARRALAVADPPRSLAQEPAHALEKARGSFERVAAALEEMVCSFATRKGGGRQAFQ